jgi:hypothetical protein
MSDNNDVFICGYNLINVKEVWFVSGMDKAQKYIDIRMMLLWEIMTNLHYVKNEEIRLKIHKEYPQYETKWFKKQSDFNLAS